MGFYNQTDIRVTPSGDLALSSGGDFDMTSSSGVLQQDISFRLRTNANEFIPHPDIGADLDELIGEPNTREVTKEGEYKISYSLTKDGMVRSEDLYIKGVPLSAERIMYYIFVNDGSIEINVTPDIIFDMMHGMTNLPGE